MGCVSICTGGTGTGFVPFLQQKSTKCFAVQGTLKVLLLGYPQLGDSLVRPQILLQVVGSHHRVPEWKGNLPGWLPLLQLALSPWPQLLPSSWDARLLSQPHRHEPVPRLPSTPPPQPSCYAVPFSFRRHRGHQMGQGAGARGRHVEAALLGG